METKTFLTGTKEYQAPSIRLHVVKTPHLICLSGEEEEEGNEKVEEQKGSWAPRYRSVWK